jgi:hypothetical protein
MITDLRALSLTQPWPFIVMNFGKDVENRSINIGNYRGPLLLHAAKGMTAEDYEAAVNFVRARFGFALAHLIPPPNSPLLVRGAIVARTNVVNQIRPGEELLLSEDQRKWYMGLHAYVFDRVVSTPIVPCKGALGFWRVPAEVIAELDEKTPPTSCEADGATTTAEPPTAVPTTLTLEPGTDQSDDARRHTLTGVDAPRQGPTMRGSLDASRLSVDLRDERTRAKAIRKIVSVLKRTRGNAVKAAEKLGAGHSTLMRWIHDYPEIAAALEQIRLEAGGTLHPNRVGAR